MDEIAVEVVPGCTHGRGALSSNLTGISPISNGRNAEGKVKGKNVSWKEDAHNQSPDLPSFHNSKLVGFALVAVLL